jgi:hypothetical protein
MGVSLVYGLGLLIIFSLFLTWVTLEIWPLIWFRVVTYREYKNLRARAVKYGLYSEYDVLPVNILPVLDLITNYYGSSVLPYLAAMQPIDNKGLVYFKSYVDWDLELRLAKENREKGLY